MENKAPCQEIDSWFNEVDLNSIEIINKETAEENTDLTMENHDICPESPRMECIYVEDILGKDPQKLKSAEVIQHECSLAYFTQVLLEGTGTNRIRSSKTYTDNAKLTSEKIEDIISYLSWISNASEILAKRINQNLITYKPESKPYLVRSSYNFCRKYTQCKEFYSRYKTPTCKEHHYVHSLLKYDVDSVIHYLKYILDNNLSINGGDFSNLCSSIRTICFVARHMAREINFIDYITKNNSENFHRNNPFSLYRKKLIREKETSLRSNSGQMKCKTVDHDFDTEFQYPTKKNREFHKSIKIPVSNGKNDINLNNRFSILTDL
ncbi:MAG: hypothetical protein QXW79_01495 [Thermoplasmata archaeon]